MTSAVSTKQPRGLYILFFAEMWERFAFYSVQTLLILFLVKNLGFSDPKAYALYGGFSSLIYLTPLIGGYLADRYLGYRLAIYIASIFYIVGFFIIVLLGSSVFYLALACLIVGNGFFKANVSSLVGALYHDNDVRRNSGYSIFYLGINAGSLVATLLSSYLFVKFNWEIAFGAAGVGILIGFLTCLVTFKQLGKIGLSPRPSSAVKKLTGLSARQSIVLASTASVFLIAALLKSPALLPYLTVAFTLATLSFFLVDAFRRDDIVTRNKILAVLLYSTLGILFYVMYVQIFSLMTLFTQRNVAREVLGYTIPSTMFVALNPAFVLSLSPLLAWLWLNWDKKGDNSILPYKFIAGLVAVALAFGVLKVGVMVSSNGMVNPLWLVLSYFFQVIGELLIAPTTLALISMLAPKDLMARMMGFSFLCVAMGFIIGGKLASLASIPSGVTDPVTMASIYANTFVLFSCIAGGGAALVFALTPLLKKLSRDSLA